MWLNLKINLNSRLLNAIDIRFKVATATGHIDGFLAPKSANLPHIGFIRQCIHAPPAREFTMRYFGTVDSFDSAAGCGQIKPDLARDNIRFETTAVLWDKKIGPPKGQRLSYEVGSDDGQPAALNLETI